jgi:hypothetical protein
LLRFSTFQFENHVSPRYPDRCSEEANSSALEIRELTQISGPTALKAAATGAKSAALHATDWLKWRPANQCLKRHVIPLTYSN